MVLRFGATSGLVPVALLNSHRKVCRLRRCEWPYPAARFQKSLYRLSSADYIHPRKPFAKKQSSLCGIKGTLSLPGILPVIEISSEDNLTVLMAETSPFFLVTVAETNLNFDSFGINVQSH